MLPPVCIVMTEMSLLMAERYPSELIQSQCVALGLKSCKSDFCRSTSSEECVCSAITERKSCLTVSLLLLEKYNTSTKTVNSMTNHKFSINKTVMSIKMPQTIWSRHRVVPMIYNTVPSFPYISRVYMNNTFSHSLSLHSQSK